MKRMKAINGYTIYLATVRDEEKYNVMAGVYYVYFSSDIRDYGISGSYPDWEADTLETAVEFCQSSNYAMAKEIAEAHTTAASFEEIEEIEKQLDNGASAEDIMEAQEADEIEEVTIAEHDGLFFVWIETADTVKKHGPYFNRAGAELAAANYIRNTQGGF